MAGNYPPGVTGSEPQIVGYPENEEMDVVEEQPVRRVSDLLPSNPWPDAEQTKLESIAGIDFSLMDARKIRVQTKFDPSGKHPAFFVLLQGAMGEQLQILVSQQVLMDKLQRLIDAQAFPIVGQFRKDGQYWDLV